MEQKETIGSKAKLSAIALSFCLITSTISLAAGEGANMRALEKCPDTPNCVCSVDERESHFIGPLRYEGDDAAALARLKTVMSEMKRTKLVEEDAGYLHYVVTTALMRFKDDVEFSLNVEAKQIEVRSASRVGKSDLGVNHKRVEEIRKAFEG